MQKLKQGMLRKLCAWSLILAMLLSQAAFARTTPQYAYIPDRSVYFYDVDTSYSWAFHEIDYLAALKIVQGTDSLLYHPAQNISRADFVLLLYRAYNMSDYSSGQYFDDVSPLAYYADAVLAARSLGIAMGTDNRFNPNMPITRAEAFSMLTRTLERANMPMSEGSLAKVTDASALPPYALSSTAKLLNANIVQPDSTGKIYPNQLISRAETAVLLYRALLAQGTDNAGRFVEHPDQIPICIGDKIYSTATIANYNPARIYKGLIEYTDFVETADGHSIVLNDRSYLEDVVVYYNGVLTVNNQKLPIAENCIAVQLAPYSVLTDGPVSTGNKFRYAKVCLNERSEAYLIYYTA